MYQMSRTLIFTHRGRERKKESERERERKRERGACGKGGGRGREFLNKIFIFLERKGIEKRKALRIII